MAGTRFLVVTALMLGGSAGCCSYCDSTYARRHPVAVATPAYGAGCTPCACQPVAQPCCPCPPGYAPAAGTVANSVPPPPPPPPGQGWQIAPGCKCP